MVSGAIKILGIIDYQINNLKSLSSALDRLDISFEIIKNPSDIEKFERIIIPGVGSFAAGMKCLKDTGWDKSIIDFANSGRKILGICLGMQLLFSFSEEFGPTNGLGLIPGSVKRLSKVPKFPVPHIGWNSVEHVRPHQISIGLKSGLDFYFVHSYHCIPSEPIDIVSVSSYGIEFAAIVSKNNIVGVQFHPEKSVPVGNRILKNFYEWQ